MSGKRKGKSPALAPPRDTNTRTKQITASAKRCRDTFRKVKDSGGFAAHTRSLADEEWKEKWERDFPPSPKRPRVVSSLQVALEETPVPAMAFMDALKNLDPDEFFASHAYTSTKEYHIAGWKAASGGLPEELYPGKEVCVSLSYKYMYTSSSRLQSFYRISC